MPFTPMVLALALFTADPKPAPAPHAAAPARTCASTARTGTFRVVTKPQAGTAMGVGLVVLENINGCLEATFITDDAGPAVIDQLSVTGDELQGHLKLSTGAAKLRLDFHGATVDGSIVQGHNAWSLEGRKTS